MWCALNDEHITMMRLIIIIWWTKKLWSPEAESGVPGTQTVCSCSVDLHHYAIEWIESVTGCPSNHHSVCSSSFLIYLCQSVGCLPGFIPGNAYPPSKEKEEEESGSRWKCGQFKSGFVLIGGLLLLLFLRCCKKFGISGSIPCSPVSP